MNTPRYLVARFNRQPANAVALCLLMVAQLAMVTGMLNASDSIEVSVVATVPVAVQLPTDPTGVQQPGQVTFTLSAPNPSAAQVVNFTVSTLLTMGTDFNLTGLATGAQAGHTVTASISIPANTQTYSVNINALDTTPRLYSMDTRQLVFTISAATNPTLIIQGQSSAMVQLSEGNLTASASVPRPNATKQNIPGLTDDPDSNRRGIVQVNFATNAALPSPSSTQRSNEGNVYLTAQFSGTAVQGTDYSSSWKVGGSGLSAGLGYGVYAGVGGDTTLWVSGPVTETLASGTPSLISFANSPQFTYSISPVSGSSMITVSPALQYPVEVGEAIIDLSTYTAPATPATGYSAVGTGSGPYALYYSGQLKFWGGGGGFTVGDVFQLSNDPAYYVVTASNLSAVYPIVSFRPYYASTTGAGLDVAITTSNDENVSTLFPVTVTNSLSNLIPVPAESTQVQITVDPILNAPSGATTATISLESSVDYGTVTPGAGTVTIADAAAVADVTTVGNATFPASNGNGGQDGTFKVSFQSGVTFSKDISVPFAVETPGLGTFYTINNVNTVGTQYLGSVTIPAGQSSALITVIPITQSSPPASAVPVTVVLQASLDYLLATTQDASANPTASLSILPNQGLVQIIATTPTAAVDNPHVVGNDGVFTVSLPGAPTTTVPLLVGFSVTGNAQPGVDYNLVSFIGGVEGTASLITGNGSTGTVTIPAGVNPSVLLAVVPLSRTVAQSAALDVTVTLTQGIGYSLNPPNTPDSAIVAISPNSPVVSVAALAQPAVIPLLPVTSYVFTVSATFPENLPGSVPISFTLGGSAVLGVDYSVSPATNTVNLSSVTPTATISITPLPSTASTTYPKTVTVSLTSGANSGYLVTTAAPSIPLSNPANTASMTISQTAPQGYASIVAITPNTTTATSPAGTPTTATEASPANFVATTDDGLFQVSLTTLANSSAATTTTVPVTIPFVVSSGTPAALPGVNYDITDINGNSLLTSPTSTTGTIVLPPSTSGSTSVFIRLVPIEQATSHAPLPVSLTLQSSTYGYYALPAAPVVSSVTALPLTTSASGQIISDAPIITLGATTNAVVPSTSGSFTIVPTNASGAPFYNGTPYVVNFALSGTAVLGTDYSVTTNTGSSTTVQIGSSQGSPVVVTPLIDELGTKTVILTLLTSGSNTYTLSTTTSATLSITLPATAYPLTFTTSASISGTVAGAPLVQIPSQLGTLGYPAVTQPPLGYALVTSPVDHFVSDDGLITVSLPNGVNGPVDVNFIASGGAGYAVAGTNYQIVQLNQSVNPPAESTVVMNNATLTGSVIIPAGANSVTLAVVPLDDNSAHQPLPVTLTLTSGPGYTIAGTAPQTVWLINQAPTLAITTSAATAALVPGVTGSFLLTPTNYAGTPLSVPFTVSGSAQLGTDYTMTVTSSTGTLLSTPTSSSLLASVGSPSPVLLNIIPKATAAGKLVTITLQPSTSYWFINDNVPGDPVATMTISSGPQIASLSPTVGALTGGTTLTITGSNLGSTTGVTVGGSAATLVSVSATSVVCTTPPGSAGPANVTVATPLVSVTDTGAFTYQGAPTIAPPLSPISGTVNGGTKVTITGTNLLATTGVTFGGIAATSVTVVSQTSVTCITPAATEGVVSVVLTTPVGVVTDAGAYTFLTSAPTITGVAPGFGPLAGGSTVTITGTNLTGASAVTFGGTAATSITVNSPTSLTCVTPLQASAGPVNVAVTTLAGTATNANSYVYEGTPNITGIAPVNGSLAGGTLVTITGSSLDGTLGVTFGGTAATAVTVVNQTTVTCVTPAGSAGLVDVVLTTSFGSVTDPSAFTYHVQTTPIVVWAAPAAISYGTPLTSTQLNAVTNPFVAGAFAYTPNTGTVLAAGAQTLSVTFTPTDTLDYATVTTTEPLHVNTVPLTITANNLSIVAGAAIPTLTANYVGFVNGDTSASLTSPVVLSTVATSSSPAGVYPITASGATDSNYAIVFVPGSLTITSATVAASQSSSSNGSSNFFKCGPGSGVSALAGLLLLVLRTQLIIRSRRR